MFSCVSDRVHCLLIVSKVILAHTRRRHITVMMAALRSTIEVSSPASLSYRSSTLCRRCKS